MEKDVYMLMKRGIAIIIGQAILKMVLSMLVPNIYNLPLFVPFFVNT